MPQGSAEIIECLSRKSGGAFGHDFVSLEQRVFCSAVNIRSFRKHRISHPSLFDKIMRNVADGYFLIVSFFHQSSDKSEDFRRKNKAGGLNNFAEALH